MNRSDLTDRIPEFIDLAEAKMKRDSRLREVSELSFTAAEGYSLPTYFKSVIDLYHDGATAFGRIKIVDPDELSNRKLNHGDTGVPRFASVIDLSSGKLLRFAPEPSGTYTLKLVFDTELDPLTDSNTSNWLLDQAPDLYLFATLAEAEAYLQEDQRVQMWLARYEDAANRWRKNKDRQAYGGSLTPRPSNVIGEAL